MSEQEQQNDPQVEDSAKDEQLGDGGKKALEAERQARKELEKKLSEATARISEFEDANRSEQEKIEARARAAEAAAETYKQQLADAQRQVIVAEVASEVGLPSELQARLQGDDRDELLKDAKKLKSLLAPEGPRKPAPVPEAGSSREAHRGAADQFADFFSNNFN